MAEKAPVKNGKLRLILDDITNLDIESFVFYANHDLKLGSGYGNAISMRGGPTIQDELNKLGPLKTTEAVVSGAGELKARYIIHAVGPRFQEADMDAKLSKTILKSLETAENKGIKAIALPAMGAGFYGVPLDKCAEIMTSAISEYLSGQTNIEEVVICAVDNHEFLAFEKQLSS